MGWCSMDSESPVFKKSEEDRRSFLKSCGRFAATVPPAMTVMLSTSLTSNAIARSTGSGHHGHGGGNGNNGRHLGHGNGNGGGRNHN